MTTKSTKVLFILLNVLIPLLCSAQFYIDDKMYPSSPTINFSNQKNLADEGVDIFFIKISENSGYIGLICNGCAFFNKRYIAGELTLYLSGNVVMKVSPKGMKKDIVDDISISIYPINSDQIAKLKENEIIAIRFKEVSQGFENVPNFVGNRNRTVSRTRKSPFSIGYDEEKENISTTDLVNNLFE